MIFTLETRIAPQACTGMADIRQEIDRIDRFMVALLSARFEYVMAASTFKTSETDVRTPQRVRTMMEKRREWAAEYGLNPDVIEKMFCDLVKYFTEEELARWQAQNPDHS